jgi:hypothetical protein
MINVCGVVNGILIVMGNGNTLKKPSPILFSPR